MLDKTRKFLMSLVVLALLGSLAAFGVFAAFSSTTTNSGNSFAAGTVAIADNDAGSALYTVAVHRWLRHRLPGYLYEQHFGGAIYAFVRGMRPGWTQADGSASGVWTQRPPLALIERLSSLLDGPRP